MDIKTCKCVSMVRFLFLCFFCWFLGTCMDPNALSLHSTDSFCVSVDLIQMMRYFSYLQWSYNKYTKYFYKWCKTMWLAWGTSLNMIYLAVTDFAVNLWPIGRRLSEHLLFSKHVAIRLCECQCRRGWMPLLFIRQYFITYPVHRINIKG